jgi:hypothetical protein
VSLFVKVPASSPDLTKCLGVAILRGQAEFRQSQRASVSSPGADTVDSRFPPLILVSRILGEGQVDNSFDYSKSYSIRARGIPYQ